MITKTQLIKHLQELGIASQGNYIKKSDAERFLKVQARKMKAAEIGEDSNQKPSGKKEAVFKVVPKSGWRQHLEDIGKKKGSVVTRTDVDGFVIYFDDEIHASFIPDKENDPEFFDKEKVKKDGFDLIFLFLSTAESKEDAPLNKYGLREPWRRYIPGVVFENAEWDKETSTVALSEDLINFIVSKSEQRTAKVKEKVRKRKDLQNTIREKFWEPILELKKKGEGYAIHYPGRDTNPYEAPLKKLRQEYADFCRQHNVDR